jgi:membrane dipeptidase
VPQIDEEFGAFDFGLEPEEETRARRLHSESMIVDMLFMGPCGYRAYTDEMVHELQEDWQEHRNAWRVFSAGSLQPIRWALRGEFPGFKACWDASGVVAGNRETMLDFIDAPFDESLAWTAIAIAQFDEFPWLVKALRARDFWLAKQDGKRAGYLSTQMTAGMYRLEHVDIASDLGVRMIQLTYNNLNLIGAGCTERTDAGISNFGARFVERMSTRGIIVDTAHCGRQTTLDACALSPLPVVASHTSAARLFEVDRAKSDEELEAIARSGGVIGVYAVPFFLAAESDASIQVMLDHIEYIVNLVGWEHVGIGTDWPLQLPSWALREILPSWTLDIGFRSEHRIEPLRNLVGFDDYRDFPNITRGLVSRGYSDEQVQGILGGNFLRVFKAVCG